MPEEAPMSLAVLSAVLLSTAPAAAEEGARNKRLSIDVSMGIRPDMASLGSTITQDGTLDTADSTMANLLYSTDKALMSDQSNSTLWYNSQNTDTTFKLMGAEPVLGGPMLGGEFGGRIRYELDDIIRFPLYLQAGFHYSTRISGGYQERVLGDVAQQNETVALLLALNGEDPEDYINGQLITQYDATWYEVPITLGIKVKAKKRPYTMAYGGAGLSYFNGGFSVSLDSDERYSNVLATHIDADSFSVTNLSPGAVQDTIDFSITGVGLNYSLGVQSGTKAGVAMFFEYNGSGTAKTTYSGGLTDESQRLLTATSSQTLAEADPNWFRQLAYPVVTTGAAFRVGVRYYFL